MSPAEEDIRALRQQNDLKAFMDEARRAARDENDRRRRLVLAHEDLAKRLTEPPLAHSAPERWTGFVPPATCAGAINTSPVRAQLVAIVAEAERRARAGRKGAVA